MQTLDEHDIEPIDLVCVNLYPFERVSSRRGVDEKEVIENIDVGGPTLIRAAAKNHDYAAVVVSPESYDAVLDELRESEGRLSDRTRESLALEAFAYTARYDTAIARWFAEREDDFPAQYTMSLEKVLDLPYGENPHQRAAYYAEVGARTHLLSMVSKLHGKELSFNNLLDLDSGRRLVDEFELPAVAIIKHNNPCGWPWARIRTTPSSWRSPPTARARTAACSASTGRSSAPLAERAELAVRGGGARARASPTRRSRSSRRSRRAADGEPGAAALADHRARHEARARRPARAGPRHRPRVARGDARRHAANPHRGGVGRAVFAMGVCKHVRSNAIVLSKGPRHRRHRRRPDEPRGLRAHRRGQGRAADIELTGAVMASDAFFPFADGPQAGDRGGRAGDHPARRLAPRLGGRGRVRRGGRGDGLHGPPPLPALTREHRSRRHCRPSGVRHPSNGRYSRGQADASSRP